MAELAELIATLGNASESYFARADAATKLGKLGDRAAIDALAESARDIESYVREKAVLALAVIGGPEAAPPLVHALSDSSSTIRRLAAKSLGRLGEPGAIGALKEATGDSSFSVSQTAKDALDLLRKQHPEAFETAKPKIETEPEPPAPKPKPPAKPKPKPPAEPKPPAKPKPPTVQKPPGPPAPEVSQPHPPPAASPHTASRRGMSKDELIEAALRGTEIHAVVSGEGRLCRVPLPAGRHQDVQLMFRRNDEGEEIISLFTKCGPAARANYEWALRTNPKLPCGAIGLVEEGRRMIFVMSECLLLSETTPRELRRALSGVAAKGDWLEKQLTGRDQL